jgi:C-terminal processing protease CtpA/Prc
MNKLCFIIVIFLISIGQTLHAQTDSIQNYVVKALDIMKAKSVNKNRVKWDSLYTDSRRKAKDLKDIKSTYPIIKDALSALKDAHSNFYPPELVKAYVLGYRATGQEFPVIESKMTSGKIAYIKVPPIACYNFKEWDEFVNTFYTKIEELALQNPKGWILDLRDNYGGMLYPMLASLSPMLNQSNVIGTVDATGSRFFFNYKDEKFSEGKTVTHQFTVKKAPKPITQPIVVMVNKKTASSGEFCAIAFVGQKNATIIGEKTQGLTSGNQEYKLSDGAFIALTIGNTIDRDKKEYDKVGEGLKPQIILEDTSDSGYMEMADKIVTKK